MHLSLSPTSIQDLFSLYSPTKHHPVLFEVIGFWIGFSDGVGSGGFGGETVVFWILIALSSAFFEVASILPLLDSFNKLPIFFTALSVICMPLIAVLLTTSDVLFIIVPVLYPKKDKMFRKNGPKMLDNICIKLPTIVKRFIPKKR